MEIMCHVTVYLHCGSPLVTLAFTQTGTKHIMSLTRQPEVLVEEADVD